MSLPVYVAWRVLGFLFFTVTCPIWIPLLAVAWVLFNACESVHSWYVKVALDWWTAKREKETKQ